MRVETGQQLPLFENSCEDSCSSCGRPVYHDPPEAPITATERVYRAVLDGRLEIDKEGRVWRGPEPAEVRYDGYLRVKASVDNKLRGTLAHRLVYRHFFGPIPDGLQVNHINGDRRDNRPSNLNLLTPSEQGFHRHNELGRGRITPEARAKGNQVQKVKRGQSQLPLPHDS